MISLETCLSHTRCDADAFTTQLLMGPWSPHSGDPFRVPVAPSYSRYSPYRRG
jgi:hypothetical protein